MEQRVTVVKLLNIFVIAWIFLLLLILTENIDGACNVCSAITGMACVSDKNFTLCVNGRPGNGSEFMCPSNLVCSTIGNVICQPNVTETATDCQMCDTCDATHTFACTSVDTFALCLGSNTSTVYSGICTPGLVCSIDYPFICGNSTDLSSGVAATCPTSVDEDVVTTPTTTLEPTTEAPVTPSVNNPMEYCQIIQQHGRFPLGTNPATTCKMYVNCFLRGSTWLGASYLCPGNSYFNSSSQLCGPNLPARCSSARIRRISLLNYELN